MKMGELDVPKWNCKVPFEQWKIKPLTGQVLVELEPIAHTTAGGIEIPERNRSPEEVQATHLRPEKPKPLVGIVKAIGRWPVLKNGMAQIPEFGIGARVVFSFNAGTGLQRDVSRKLRLVRFADVLAVL